MVDEILLEIEAPQLHLVFKVLYGSDAVALKPKTLQSGVFFQTLNLSNPYHEIKHIIITNKIYIIYSRVKFSSMLKAHLICNTVFSKCLV